MKVVIVCIVLGYVFGCIVGFIGGRFVQEKDVKKFKSDYHKLCELKDIRIHKLENKNKAAKEIITKLSKYVSDSKWYVQNGYVTLQKELVEKAEVFLEEV